MLVKLMCKFLIYSTDRTVFVTINNYHQVRVSYMQTKFLIEFL